VPHIPIVTIPVLIIFLNILPPFSLLKITKMSKSVKYLFRGGFKSN